MEELDIKFRVNEEIIALRVPIDGSDHLFRITNDDEYAINYVHQLMNSGFIGLNEPVHRICRIDDDDEVEREIFAAESTTHASSEVGKTLHKEICTWTDSETILLLDTYEQSLTKVGPMKQFKTKKSMWAEIANILNKQFNSSKTAVQCENRFKTVLKRKKAAVDNNKTSGHSRETIPFENELNKIASIDDSIEPEVVGTNNGVRILKRKLPQNSENAENISPSTSQQGANENINTPTTSHIPKRKRTLTVQETLLEIFEKKEEKRERRHREKLDLIREIFSRNNNENMN